LETHAKTGAAEHKQYLSSVEHIPRAHVA
jgi:hypothetical protein